MRKIILMAIAVSAVIIAVYWLAKTTSHTTESRQAATVGQAADGNAVTIPVATAGRTVALLDVPITMNGNGDLVVDTNIKQLFDLLAQQNTDQPVDQWKHQVLDQFSDQLTPQAKQELQQLFDRYVEFNLALQLLPMEGSPDLASVLDKVQQLREHYLGSETAQQMYADWSALEDFTNQYIDTMTQTRDPQAAQAKLQNLAESLPAPVRQRALNMLQQNDDEMATSDLGKVNPEAYARMLQEQAAVALIETQLTFDEPTPEFMGRYQQYNQEKQKVLLSNASQAQQQTELQQLRARYFNGSERLRVETLDRADAF